MNNPHHFQFGSLVYPGLAKLVEEGGEVQEVAGKLMATGGEPEHWDGSRLNIRIAEEVADLSAACRVFFQLNGYDGAPWVLEREQHKYHLFLQWHRDNLPDKDDEVTTDKPKAGWNKIQRFFGAGSDEHYQTYWAWRVYPKAVQLAMLVGFNIGVLATSAIWIVARNLGY